MNNPMNNSATAQLPQGHDTRDVPLTSPVAFSPVAASVLFHDALRACVDAHTSLNVLEGGDPNLAVHELRADAATAHLCETIDSIYSRRLALLLAGGGAQ